MKELKKYLKAKQKVHDYFGYMSDWAEIPIESYTNMYWILMQNENGSGIVRFHEKDDETGLYSLGENYYEHMIYTQRHLPKWVYVGKDYTMISVDTRTDGNKFLGIFDNSKRRYLPD